jgi:peroxiredoxin
MNLARPLVVTVIAALALAAAALAWRPVARGDPAPIVPAQVPAVSYTLLDGRKSSTEALRGKVVLINFWATTCSICVAEMPQIVRTHDKFKARGYETLAVAMRHDAPANVVRFAESRQLPFGVAIDNTGEIAEHFGNVQITPTTFLVNKRGNVVRHFVGTPDFTVLHELIGKLLAET